MAGRAESRQGLSVWEVARKAARVWACGVSRTGGRGAPGGVTRHLGPLLAGGRANGEVVRRSAPLVRDSRVVYPGTWRAQTLPDWKQVYQGHVPLVTPCPPAWWQLAALG